MTDTPDNITPLGVVPKPKAEDKIQAEILKLLDSMRGLALEGNLECIFIIAAHPDGTYSEAISSTAQFRQMIGQVEIVKQNWIWKYLTSLSGAPLGKGPGL